MKQTTAIIAAIVAMMVLGCTGYLTKPNPAYDPDHDGGGSATDLGQHAAPNTDIASTDAGEPDLGTEAGTDTGVDQGVDAGPVCTPTEEVCDGKDNDCDGQTDEELEAPLADKREGVCTGAQKICAGINGWQEPDYTVIEWIDFPGARYEYRDGDHAPAPGIRVFATPGHSPGHQSLLVETPEGNLLLAGQAVYSHGEWSGIADAREGASVARDRAAYDASVARLKALNPKRVLFGHDRRGWP